MQNGRTVVVVWAEAVLGHPFCGLAGTLRAVVRALRIAPGGAEVRRIRDAYLEPWHGLAAPKELRKEFATAGILARLCRALDIERLIARLEPAARERWERKAARWRRDFTQFQTDKY